MIHEDTVPAPRSWLAELKTTTAAFGKWSPISRWFALGIVILYAPVVWEVGQAWFSNENYAHGVFILPVCLFLLWIQRDPLRQTATAPVAWGLIPLGAGLFLQVAGYLLHVNFIAMVSLLPTLAGMILILHGKELWRQTRFIVGYLIFAVPFPGTLLVAPSNWIQSASTTGAVAVTKALGYTVLQTGNIVEIPGMALEVAEVCSGFKKLVALLAFSLLYGYLFQISPAKRLLLFLAAIPVALLANVIRVAGLIAVSSAGGTAALNIAHDWAEIFVLVVAFGLFVLVGKALGCKTLRFSP